MSDSPIRASAAGSSDGTSGALGEAGPAALNGLALDHLRSSEQRSRRLFETARDGILLLNAATAQIEDVNPFLIELLGYSHAELLGRKLWEVGAFADIAQCKQMFERLKTRGYIRYDNLPLRTRAGIRIEVEFVSNCYDCEGTRVIQCNIRDISERRQLERQLQQLAFHDPLTHLPNRRLLLDRLQHAVLACRRASTFGAVLFIDLNRFKALNDAHGHAFGDRVLLETARRLLGLVRATDTVARFGGDEFVILLDQLGADPAMAAQSAAQISGKVELALAETYALGELSYQGSCSIGTRLFAGSERDAEQIITAADVEMYRAKRANGSDAPPSSPGYQ
jgi:diguanylate cyclase (GGDEF)-like protein/PAS domain S-box-containing protein